MPHPRLLLALQAVMLAGLMAAAILAAPAGHPGLRTADAGKAPDAQKVLLR